MQSSDANNSDNNANAGNGSRRSTQPQTSPVRAADDAVAGATDGAPRAVQEEQFMSHRRRLRRAENRAQLQRLLDMEQRFAESSLREAHQADARVCQQRLVDRIRRLGLAPGGNPDPVTVERVRPAERVRREHPAYPGTEREAQRQRREDPSTHDVAQAERVERTEQGNPVTVERVRPAVRVRREHPTYPGTEREAQRQRREGPSTHDVEQAERMERAEQGNPVTVERVRLPGQVRREHLASPGTERATRRQAGGARARESATAAQRGDTAMVGDDAFARERGRLLRRQQQEQAVARRRECRREDERTRVEQQRRLRRQERWDRAAEARRRRTLVDIDAVRRRTQEADRVQRHRWLLRAQRWEQTLARRRERTLLDLDIIRRYTGEDIERAQHRMNEDATRIHRRSLDAVTRVWQQLDNNLANDAYDDFSDENEVGVGSHGRTAPAAQQEGTAPAAQQERTAPAAQQEGTAPATQPVGTDGGGRGERERQAEQEGPRWCRERDDENEGRQAPQQ